MSAEAGFDFNTQAIRMGLGTGGKGGGGDPVANEKDLIENLLDNVGSSGSGLTSMLVGVPNIEGITSTGINKPFEIPEGLHEKMINPFGASFSTQGGFLYKMFSALIKKGDIEDMTVGIEPLQMIEGSYGDGGGGGDTGGGATGESGFVDSGAAPIEGAPIEPMTVNVAGRSYEVAGVGESGLGSFSPSSGGGGMGGDDIGRG